MCWSLALFSSVARLAVPPALSWTLGTQGSRLRHHPEPWLRCASFCKDKGNLVILDSSGLFIS